MSSTTVDNSNTNDDLKSVNNKANNGSNASGANSRQSTPPNLIFTDPTKKGYTPLISKAMPTIMTHSTTASASVSAANSRPASWISTGTTRPLSTHSTLLDKVSSPSLSREGSVKGSSTSSRGLNKQHSRNSLASALTAHLDRLFIAKAGSDMDAASIHSQPYLPSPTSLSDQMGPSLQQNGGGSLRQAISPPNSDLVDEVILEENEELELAQKLKDLAPSLPPTLVSEEPESIKDISEQLDSDLDSEGEEFNGSIHRRRFSTENTLSENWKKFKKHFFILSSAGKPIYSRYGDESQLSGLTGIIQAMVSVFLDDNDPIRFINIGSKKVIFLIQDHLYFIMVSNTSESELVLREQLQTFNLQVLSLVTQSQIQKVFSKRRNYDLRGLLSGTEIFLDSICKRLSSISPSLLFKAIRPQRLTKEIRGKLSSSLKIEPIPDGLLYIMLVSKYRLLHVSHSKKVVLNPTDLHLVLNLIHSSPNFNTLNQESWLPICLPKFNSTGFLHALIYPVSHNPLLSLILLTSNKDTFFDLSQLKESILAQLEQHSLLTEIQNLMLDPDYLPIEFNSRGLRHFYFKNLQIGQFIGSKFDSPFVEKVERKRIFSLYQSAYTKLHNPDKPIRLHFEVTDNEIVLGWITPSFELYATYDQFMTKSTILNSALSLIKGIKIQQDNLFITQIPTF